MIASKPHRYAAFGLLYLAQGTIMAFFTALNAIYLLDFGVSMARVGIVSAIGMVPFVLKIFMGMLSDRVNLFGRGHRLPYIVLGVLIQAVGLFVIVLIDPGAAFGLYCVVVFITLAGMALYDTCTDGLAVDTTPVEEEGTVQSVMVGGRALGVVMIALALGVLAQHSWRAVFWALSAVTLIPLFTLKGLTEPARGRGQRFQWRAFGAMGSRAVLAVALFGVFTSVVTYGANELLNPFLKETFGISNARAGHYTAVWGVGTIIGALIAGRLVDRWGQKRTAMAAACMAALAVAGLSQIQSPGEAWAFVALFGLAFGFYETIFFALAMSVCQPAISASMYAILMAVANVGAGIGLVVSGSLVDVPTLGYRGALLLLAACNALVLLTVPLIATGRPCRDDLAAPVEVAEDAA